MRESIDYDEIIERIYDKDEEFMKELKHISDNIPYRYYKVNYIERVLDFVNNYIIEMSMIECFENFYFYDDTHFDLHSGKGNNNPDFIIDYTHFTVTGELKSVRDLSKVSKIKNWHRADRCYVFNKADEKLYFYNRYNETLTKIDGFKLNRKLIKLNEIT